MRRNGFTLVEMLITIAIFAVVMAELVIVFVGLFQYEKNKMWDTELATKLRVAREHLLFSAVPPTGDKKYGGILSATNLVWSSPHITAAFQYVGKDGTPGVDPNEDVSERFLVRNVDNGERDVPPVIVSNDFFFVNTAVTVNGSNRTERIAVSAFGKKFGLADAVGAFMETHAFESYTEDVRWVP